MKHNGEEVTDPVEFGNSWKVDTNCLDVTNTIDLCEKNPHRKAWAEKRCSIINNKVFEECNASVSISINYEYYRIKVICLRFVIFSMLK